MSSATRMITLLDVCKHPHFKPSSNGKEVTRSIQSVIESITGAPEVIRNCNDIAHKFCQRWRKRGYKIEKFVTYEKTWLAGKIVMVLFNSSPTDQPKWAEFILK